MRTAACTLLKQQQHPHQCLFSVAQLRQHLCGLLCLVHVLLSYTCLCPLACEPLRPAKTDWSAVLQSVPLQCTCRRSKGLHNSHIDPSCT